LEITGDDEEIPTTGHRHRVLVSGPAGVHPASLEEAVVLMDRDGGAQPAQGTAARLVWIDIVGPTEEDGAFLREELRFHPLAVEDCLHGRQYPKLERYPGYFFLVLYAARINPERNRPAFYELHCFVGPTFLVTVRQESIREVRHLMARWRGAEEHFPTIGHLTHALIDGIVDSYFPMVDHFSARVGATESEVYERPEQAMEHIVGLRRELLRFRGVIGPTRDVLSSLMRRDLPFLEPDLVPYFQDVREHAVRVSEEIDMLRDLLSTAVEAQFTVTSNQLNQTVRMLTAWSIILMSSTLVAGIYGMNFALMPELQWRYGYPFALAIMLVIAGVLVAFFRRRRWL
jgi:magnesium transporter